MLCGRGVHPILLLGLCSAALVGLLHVGLASLAPQPARGARGAVFSPKQGA